MTYELTEVDVAKMVEAYINSLAKTIKFQEETIEELKKQIFNILMENETLQKKLNKHSEEV